MDYITPVNEIDELVFVSRSDITKFDFKIEMKIILFIYFKTFDAARHC